jgi:adenine/guanine phosphoribosyltransferase-like PRPP-binding protein
VTSAKPSIKKSKPRKTPGRAPKRFPRPITLNWREKEFQYNQSLFNGFSLSHFVPKYFQALPKDVDFLLSRGASGCSLGAALALYAGLKGKRLSHVHMRKENEIAHASIAGPLRSILNLDSPRLKPGCIVDDFISSGETIETLYRFALVQGLHIKYILVHHVDGFYIPPARVSLILIKEGDEE